MILKSCRVDGNYWAGGREVCGLGVGSRWLIALIVGLVVVSFTERGKADEAPPPRRPSTDQPKPTLADRVASITQPAPKTNALPVYELKMEPGNLASLERTALSDDTYPAIFSFNGRVYDGVKVRCRGQWSRTWPKKSLKIFFGGDETFDGQRCLNLNSGWHDPAFVRETLAYQVYAACGVPASKTRLVRLDLNGRFRGLYVEVEQPDKAFLRRINMSGATLFKAISRLNQADERDLGSEESYRVHYERETQKTKGYRELHLLCLEMARTTNVLKFFSEHVDLDRYISYLAANVLLQNWDCLNKNHFLLFDAEDSKKWSVVPWDLDRTLGDDWRGGFDQTKEPILLGTRRLQGPTGWNRMADRFFSEPELRSRFLRRLDDLLEKEFISEKLFSILDRLEADIRDAAALDRARWPGVTTDLHSGIAEVKDYILQRHTFLQSQLAEVRRTEQAR